MNTNIDVKTLLANKGEKALRECFFIIPLPYDRNVNGYIGDQKYIGTNN